MPALSLTPLSLSLRARAWVLALGAAALPLIHAQGLLWQAHTVPKMALARLVAVVLAAVGGIVLIAARGPLRLSWTGILAFGFLGWIGVTSLAGVGVHQSLLGAVHRYEGWAGVSVYVVFFLTARALASSARTLAGRSGAPPPAMGLAACVVGGVVGLIGVAQAVWPAGHPVRFLGLEALDRSASTFGNPIYLGLFVALVIPFGLASLATRESRAVRAGGAACLGALAAAGYLTYSRGAWLGVVVGVAVLVAIVGGRRRRLLGPAFVTCLVAAVLVAGATWTPHTGGLDGEDLTAGGRMEETLTGGGTVGTRIELYRGAARLIAERPALGFGLETYGSQAARVRTLRLVQLESPTAFPDRPHNPQLYLTYSAGVPGLALYAALVLSALTGGFVRLRRAGDPHAAVALAGLLAGCVGYLAAELTSFSVIEVTPLFWAALGWLSASSLPRGVWLPRPAAKAAGVVLLAALVPVAYALLGHAVDVTVADRIHYGLVTQVQDPSRFREFEQEEARAATLDPYTPFYWNTRALILSHAWSAGGPPGLLGEAEAVLASGLERIPADPTLTVSLSDVQMKAGRPRAAVELLEAYIRTDPFLEDARFNLALAYLAVGEPARAVDELRQAVLLVPTDAEAFWYLAQALEAVGDRSAADAARSRALELDPALAEK